VSGVEADDLDAVWGVGMIDLPPLNEEAFLPWPLERRSRARGVRLVRGAGRTHADFAGIDVARDSYLGFTRARE
jgi:hypothetical protein